VNGRLIDLVCGSMVYRTDRYVVMHSQTCLKRSQGGGGLASSRTTKALVSG